VNSVTDFRVWTQSKRTFATIFLVRDRRDVAYRTISVSIAVAIAALSGVWICYEPEGQPRGWYVTWFVCGTISITSAAVIAGWCGARLLFLVPVLMAALSTLFGLVSIEVADELGYPLDSLFGINVAGLGFFAGIAGLLMVAPIAYTHHLLFPQRLLPVEPNRSGTDRFRNNGSAAGV
jgi:hypothetical protein